MTVDSIYTPTHEDMLHMRRLCILSRKAIRTRNQWLRDLCIRKHRELHEQRAPAMVRHMEIEMGIYRGKN